MVHVALLSLCVGALVMVGAAAAVAFPAAHRLNPTLAGMEGYTGEHWVLAGPAHLRKVDLAARQILVDWPAELE